MFSNWLLQKLTHALCITYRSPHYACPEVIRVSFVFFSARIFLHLCDRCLYVVFCLPLLVGLLVNKLSVNFCELLEVVGIGTGSD